MLNLTGVFVCGEKESQSFPGALFFRRSSGPASVLLVICKPGCRPHRICHNCIVEISGHYLHTTLRGLKVFEAETLQYSTTSCTHVLSDVPTNKTPLHWISGTVTSVSQCFKLKSGHTTFISLRCGSSSEDTRLLLLEQAVQCSPYLSYGDQIEVFNSTRFRWKSSEHTASESSSTAIKAESDEGSVFYFVDQVSNFRIAVTALAQPSGVNTAVVDASLHSTAAQPKKKAFIPTAAALLNPRTLLQKELLSHTEFAQLTGTVQAVHTIGWIELSNVVLHEHYAPTCVYDGPHVGGSGGTAVNSSGGNHSGNADVGIDLQSSVVYLAPTLVQHLRSTALGVSVRQTATIHVTNLIPTYLWGKLKGFATTCRSVLSIASFAENKSFHSEDPTYCAVNISIPAEIKSSCVLYAVWRAEISRKLAHCIGVEVVQKHANLCASVVKQIESWATYTHTSSNPCTVADVMRLPPGAIQDELYNLQYILLHAIHNGLDADWLGNNLPQMWSVSTLMSKLTHIHSTAVQVPSSILFGVYHYDLCAVTPNSNIWSQYSAQHNHVVRKNIVIMGTVKRVSVPPGVQDTGPAPAQDSPPSAQTSGFALAELVVSDASGGSIAVLVRDMDTLWLATTVQKCQSHLHTACPLCRNSHTNSNSTRRQQYCSCLHRIKAESGNSCSSAASNSNGPLYPLYVVIHNPQCLLEQPPQQDTVDAHTSTAAKQRPYLLCSAVDMCFIGNGASPPAATTTGTTRAATSGSSERIAELSEPPISAPVTTEYASGAGTHNDQVPAMSVRQLVSLDLKQYNSKYIAHVRAVVVNKQLIEVDFKSDAFLPAGDPKRRKLSAQASVYEDTQRGFVARNETDMGDRKCCITLRDVCFADVIHLFLPYRAVQCVLVGSVVDLNSVYLCLPDNKKKLYLKSVEGANKTEIGTYFIEKLALQWIVFTFLCACYFAPCCGAKLYTQLVVYNFWLHFNVVFPVVCSSEMAGFLSGLQLQRLCEFSRYTPDPRFIDVVYQGSTTRCNFQYRPPGCVGLSSVKAGCGQVSRTSQCDVQMCVVHIEPLRCTITVVKCRYSHYFGDTGCNPPISNYALI